MVDAQLNLTDELFARPAKLKLFLSSKMRDGALKQERKAAADVIASLGFAEPWWWEGNAAAGPYCAKGICLGHARTSDGLVLIIGDELTTMTQEEFQAAQDAGVECFIFVQDGVSRDDETDGFIGEQQQHATTGQWATVEELESQIVRAIHNAVIRSHRVRALERRGRDRSTDQGTQS